MKRKLALILTAILILPFALSGCGGGAADGENTLRVYNWGNYIDPTVLDMFEEETGIKVIYDTFEMNEDMYTKIKNSNGPTYDVCIPSDYMIKRMIDEDMLQKIDFANVPNYSLINPELKDLEFDPGNEYSVPYMWGTIGILYNKTMVDEPPASWDSLWDPRYEKQIFMLNSVRDSVGIALMRLGYSLNSTDESQLKDAEEILKEQKPLVLAYYVDEIRDKMIAGEAAMGVVYSGDAFTSIQENPDLAYAVPQEGTNLWFDSMVILKDAPNKAAAEQFINFMCSTEIAAMNRDEIEYSTPQVEVYNSLSEEIKLEQYPSDEIIAKSQGFVDLGESVSYYEELWTRVLAS